MPREWKDKEEDKEKKEAQKAQAQLYLLRFTALVPHPASYPMGTSGRVVKLTTHVHLVSRSKNELSYTSISPICLRGVVHS